MLIFSVVKIAARVVEHQMGFVMARIYDPLSGEDAQPLSLFMDMVFMLLFLSAIMKVPQTRQADFYRKLLELNFLRTSDGAFAIDAQNDYVYLRAFRGLAGIDYIEFVDMLDTVAQVADEWDDKLKEEFGADA